MDFSVFRCILLLFLAFVLAGSRKIIAARFRLTRNAASRLRISTILYRTVTRTSSMGITMSSMSSEPPSPAVPSLPLPDPDKIDPEDIAEWLRNGGKNLVIIDVRDDDFVEGGHIKGCTNIPSGIFMEKWHSCDGLLTNYAANGEAQVCSRQLVFLTLANY